MASDEVTITIGLDRILAEKIKEEYPNTSIEQAIQQDLEDAYGYQYCPVCEKLTSPERWIDDCCDQCKEEAGK